MKNITINIEPYMIGKKIVISLENNDENKTTDRKNFSHDHCHHCENTNSPLTKKSKKHKKNSATANTESKTPKMDVDMSMQLTNLRGEIADLKGGNEKLKKENEFLEKKCEGLKLYAKLLDKYHHDDFSGDFWKTVSKLSKFLKTVKETSSEVKK